MKVSANPAYARFRRRMVELPMPPWRGAAYRVTTLDYPSAASILSGQGSFLYGGRWNAIGSFRAVYGSVSDVLAVAESRATADYAGMAYSFRTPRLLVMLELDLAKVVDLSNQQVRLRFALTEEELRVEDWRRIQDAGKESLTQAFGRACFDSGANGLLAPSSKVPGGVNVVYFPENRSSPDDAKVCEAEKLARIRTSE